MATVMSQILCHLTVKLTRELKSLTLEDSEVKNVRICRLA